MKRTLLPLLALALPALAQDPATNAATAGAISDPNYAETPETILRLENLDALREGIAALAEWHGKTPEQADREAETTVVALFASVGLSAVDESRPVFAGLWRFSPADTSRTEWVFAVPVPSTALSRRLLVQRLERLPATQVAGLEVREVPRRKGKPLHFAFEGDWCYVASHPAHLGARAALLAAERTFPDAGLSIVVPAPPPEDRDEDRADPFRVALSEDAADPDREFGGSLTFGLPFGFGTRDLGLDSARGGLVLTREAGVRFALAGPLAREASPDAFRPLAEADLAAIPADALAWRIDHSGRLAPVASLILNDSPANRRRKPALDAFFAAFAALCRATGDDARAILAPDGRGHCRAELRHACRDADAVLAFGRALAELRRSEWDVCGTNALALFSPDAASLSADGLSAALHPAAAGLDRFAAIFGADADFRLEIADGQMRGSLRPDGTDDADDAREPGPPVALPDPPRGWFPELVPDSFWGIRIRALKAFPGPAPADDRAVLAATGRCGEERVIVFHAPPEELRALGGDRAAPPATPSPAEEPHAEPAETAKLDIPPELC